jgi:lipopolysaccharide transport system ATP-binding protein
VSHNLVAVQDLCHRVIWIDGGRVVEEGEPAEVIGHYLQNSYATLTEQVWHDFALAPGDDEARLHRLCVRPASGAPSDPITVRTPLVIEFEYWNHNPRVYLNPTFNLYNERGILICSVGPTYLPDWRERTFPVGLIRSRCYLPGDLLNDGIHRVAIHLGKNDQTLVQNEDALTFDVYDTTEQRDGWYGKWEGAIRPIFDWDVEIISSSANRTMRASP